MPALTLSGGQSLALGSSTVQAVYRGSELKHFNPKAIPGCICNLDASVLSSLFQNSDGTTPATATDNPVGYWADLSGLGNHARQTVATGSRPFLKLNNQNGRPGLLFDGSNDWITATIEGFQSLTGVTVLQVVKPTAAAAADVSSALFFGFGNAGVGSGVFPASRVFTFASATGGLSGETINFAIENATFSAGRLGSSTYARSASTAQLLAITAGSGGTNVFANNAAVSLNLTNQITTTTATAPANAGYTVDNEVHFNALRAGGVIVPGAASTLHQVIVYNRVLTGSELTAIWTAMQVKWGIA